MNELIFDLFISNRRSALAQRQREEEQLKGKLTAEEARRQVKSNIGKRNVLISMNFFCKGRTRGSRCS